MAKISTERWSLTREAFQGLLAKLGPDDESAAGEYEEVRRRLIGFFDRRGAFAAEALADEAIDRVARRLEAGEAVQHLRAYFYGVAKRIWMEHGKEGARQRAALAGAGLAGGGGDSADEEREAACLEECLRELPGANRQLILLYYQGAGEALLGGRKQLAATLGLTYPTLRSRARRIREQLEECFQRCMKGRDHGHG